MNNDNVLGVELTGIVDITEVRCGRGVWPELLEKLLVEIKTKRLAIIICSH